MVHGNPNLEYFFKKVKGRHVLAVQHSSAAHTVTGGGGVAAAASPSPGRGNQHRLTQQDYQTYGHLHLPLRPAPRRSVPRPAPVPPLPPTWPHKSLKETDFPRVRKCSPNARWALGQGPRTHLHLLCVLQPRQMFLLLILEADFVHFFCFEF